MSTLSQPPLGEEPHSPLHRKLPCDLRAVLHGGDALIIVPPFIFCEAPSLGAHILQACAANAGFRVSVLYANLSLLTQIGEANYAAIGYGPSLKELTGERFFAAAAYGLPLLGTCSERLRGYHENPNQTNPPASISWSEIQRMASAAGEWADALAEAVARIGYLVVGCTAVAQQTSASVALLSRIKRLRPETITIIGGANCEGDMAFGIASLSPAIDFIFSGEGENAFPNFLEQIRSGTRPARRVIFGEPCGHLDSIPPMRFAEYFEQYEYFKPGSPMAKTWLPYQSSRGCWWGRKHHCTFCGNYPGEGYREKSPDRVIAELTRLAAETPSRGVVFVDSVMPYSYFHTLIPRLACELLDMHFFYEQKSNLSLRKVLALKNARVTEFQAGIEALSTPLLKRMNKGVTAAQNIRLLRYARSAQLVCAWNLLFGFPGDQPEEYRGVLALLPLLHHLNPPVILNRMGIDRFSPYWENPAAYGLSNIRPFPAYAETFPVSADVERLAYHFLADFDSGSISDVELIGLLHEEVDSWRKAWITGNGAQPQLWVNRLGGDLFLLRDTRGLPGTQESRVIPLDHAAAALAGRHVSAEARKWALDHKVAVVLEGEYLPLATATPELLFEFEGG